MSAVSNSIELVYLTIRSIYPNEEPDHFRAIVEAIPSMETFEITLQFEEESTDELQSNLLESLKRNYFFLDIYVLCFANGPTSAENWFNEANQSRLDFYLHRNKKLAEWTENPALVPSDLWPFAISLALKAGINSLFESLIALSGEGVGLRRKGRKRKRPEYYDP